MTDPTREQSHAARIAAMTVRLDTDANTRRATVAFLIAMTRKGNTGWARDTIPSAIADSSNAVLAATTDEAARWFRPRSTTTDQRLAARGEALMARFT